MRTKPILLAAAAAVAGLAALGTVVAQQPARIPPPAMPTVRPYNEWTPTTPVTPPANAAPGSTGARPLGGSYVPPPSGANVPAMYPPPGGTQGLYPPPGGTPGNRPRLATPPAPATGGVQRASFDLPPPSMDWQSPKSATSAAVPPVAPAGKMLPPPSISLDPSDNKFPAPTPLAPTTTPPAARSPASTGTALPVPPIPDVKAPIVPPPGLPTTPLAPQPPTGTPTDARPRPFPVPATPTPGVSNAVLPNKVNQGVSIEAICPETVVFNAQFEYVLVVHNTGNVAVQNVRVEDELPRGARYIGSDPPAELNGEKLVWSVGSMDAHADKRITVRVRPSEEGELRSRATVYCSSSVEAKARVTRPRVAITTTCPEVCRVGQDAVFQIKVTNSGTGPAQNMVLRAEMSDGLFFAEAPKLTKLDTTLSALPAGATKTLTLPLNAIKAGLHSCRFTVTADGSSDISAKSEVRVVEPLLQVAQSGPAKCLVRAEPTYEVTLTNPGSAATDPITVQSRLPDGFDYVQASDAGAFNATTRVISWKLSALQPGGTKTIAVKLRAAAAGDAVLRTTAVAASEVTVQHAGAGLKPSGRILEAKSETPIKAEGVAAVRFEVRDLEDPVEVGKEAVYEIRVINQGTGACTNVQLMAAMAEGVSFSSCSGTGVKQQGQTLVFDAIPNLAVKGQAVFTVKVKGNTPGDLRFRVQLTCDQMRTPVVKEESTSFYKQ